jgi:hypothetical protein
MKKQSQIIKYSSSGINASLFLVGWFVLGFFYYSKIDESGAKFESWNTSLLLSDFLIYIFWKFY